MFKFCLLSANVLQLTWAEQILFLIRFVARWLKLHRAWPFAPKPVCRMKGISECIPCLCVWIWAGGPVFVYWPESCDKLRIMNRGFYLNAPKPGTNEPSQSHFTLQKAKLPLSLTSHPPNPSPFLSFSLLSTFNVQNFDSEHPISRVMVCWLYMQMGC